MQDAWSFPPMMIMTVTMATMEMGMGIGTDMEAGMNTGMDMGTMIDGEIACVGMISET